MRRHSLTAVVLFAATLGLASPVAEQRGVIMRRVGEQRVPIFIPATELFTETGEFAPVVPQDWRSRQAAARRLLNDVAARQGSRHVLNTEPCGGVLHGEADVEALVIRDSRESTIANARGIFVGTIATATPGLFDAKSGSLLELRNIETLKADAAYSGVRERLYVRHPAAYFRAGGLEFCRNIRAGAHVPEPGDQVLVFAFGEPADESGRLVYSFADDLIVQAANGEMEIPRLLSFFGTEEGGVRAIAKSIKRSIEMSRAGHRR